MKASSGTGSVLRHRELRLSGCVPVPLASYLKALAVLRLVAEQADPNAAGSWSNEAFCLRCELTPEQLVTFFQRDYRPSPIVAPWNGGSGFYPKDNREAISVISASEADRLASYRCVIQAASDTLGVAGENDKAEFLELCRGTLADEALQWLDAAFVLSQDGPKYPPLLGTGGNDGRLEFSNNFMQRLVAVIDPQTGEPTPHSERWLRAARDGVDFTRAVVTLGVDRGISEFQRYGFQVRNGLAYFATPLERVAVQRNAQADLLSDIDQWLDRFRGKADRENAPGSVARVLRNLEASIVELCKEGSAARVQRLLIELGQCERTFAQSLKWTTENFLTPVPALRSQWLRVAETDTLEFRLVAALASLHGRYAGKWIPLRVHMEPVFFGRRKDRSWIGWEANPGSDLVWHSADLTDSLNAAFARRLLYACDDERGLSDTSKVTVSFADLADFIENDRADRRIEELLWGLNLIDWTAIAGSDLPSAPIDDDPPPSSLYALLKLCFARVATSEEPLPLDPRSTITPRTATAKPPSASPPIASAAPASRPRSITSPCGASSSTAPPPR